MFCESCKTRFVWSEAKSLLDVAPRLVQRRLAQPRPPRRPVAPLVTDAMRRVVSLVKQRPVVGMLYIDAEHCRRRMRRRRRRLACKKSEAESTSAASTSAASASAAASSSATLSCAAAVAIASPTDRAPSSAAVRTAIQI